MNQVQRINYRIESQTIFELVLFIASPNYAQDPKTLKVVEPMHTLTFIINALYC